VQNALTLGRLGLKLIILLLLFTILVAVGCNSEYEAEVIIAITSTPMSTSSSTPRSQIVITSTPPPSATPGQTSIPSPSPSLTAVPTTSPTAAPLPRPFEISVTLTSVPYPLPFATEDGIAFLIQNDRFFISNIADPHNIKTIWESQPLSDETQGLAVINNYAFLVSANHIEVWDIADLSNPSVAATFPNSGGEALVDTEGNLLYLVMPTNGGQIITVDISLPTLLSELGRVDLIGLRDGSRAWYPYLISQQRLFLVNDDYIEIIDLSDSTLAKPLAQLSVPTNIESEIYIKDNLLFVGTDSGVYVFDLTEGCA
jgi:hypothetical protein